MVYGMLESQLCSTTNKFKTSAKEFLGWHFVPCCFGDILSDDACLAVGVKSQIISFF
jgi:hypothetical protein